MSNFPNPGQGIALNFGDEKATSTTKTHFLGTLAYTPDGRRFRYALNGGTSIAGAKLVQNAAAVGSSVHAFGLQWSTAYHGGDTITTRTSTNAASTIALIMVTTNVSSANMYQDGYLHIDTAPGRGVYVIKAHASGTSGSTVAFELYEGIRDAFSTATRLGVRRNPYDSVIVAPATQTGLVLGVTPKEIPANNYFWLQEGGFGSLNADTLTTVAGGPFVFTGSSAGNAFAATSNPDHISFPIVAKAVTAGSAADTDHFVRITVD